MSKKIKKKGTREIRFPIVDSYRTNDQLIKVIDYWVNSSELLSEDRFQSKSHFVRCAIISFDRILKKKEVLTDFSMQEIEKKL